MVLKKVPFFIVLFAVYPSLALFGWNFREVDSNIILRPLIFSVLLALIFSLLCSRLIGNWSRASLMATAFLVIFFSYGHVAIFFEGSRLYESIGSATWPVNIFLPTLALLAAFLVSRFLLKTKKDIVQIYPILNTMSAFLVLSSSFIIAGKYDQQQAAPARQEQKSSQDPSSPDVYYIILDAYARQDALTALGYDNSTFIKELEHMGFYVASCSRSNYPQTVMSLASSLNMGYLWDVIPDQGANDRNSEPVYASILHSQVRQEFEDRGYEIVAFDSGVQWLNWRDADRFVAPEPDPFLSTHLKPFEYVFLDTTALHPIMTQAFLLRSKYVYNYDMILFALDKLPEIAQMEGPKFIYVHMLIPHRPNIFLPDGSMNLDTDYYKKGVGEGINRQYDIKGYINNTKFINSRLPDVIRKIIQISKTPPVIIVQGDHGYQLPDIRFDNLNAYYFPDGNYSHLYPTITPVNTFRTVLDNYFGGDYPLLKDQSINVGINRPFGKKIMKPDPAKCS